MKKVLFWLLILAAGAGAYYFLQKQKSPVAEFKKELIVGGWRLDSFSARQGFDTSKFINWRRGPDSLVRQRVYDFRPGGQLLISVGGDSTAYRDTAAFSWGPANELRWKEHGGDSASESYTVVKLDENELSLRTSDSVLIFFQRATD